MFGSSLNISSVFLCYMSPVGGAPNGSHLYLYLQNWCENVVKYDGFCLTSSCDIWNFHL